ncbi:MAG: glycosyl transferase [Nitrospirae bacterium RIFCSPHIGHO2_02_FULL_42_12]|nr:MAG: glycosyl transferase [Nitrospirae bacterium RIFCSPHIGHO2_02_FULL_42_12]
MKISVVMPVFNEAGTIREIIKKIEDVDLEKELIIVDDCSTDGTRDILKALERNPGIRVFCHEKNMGKGAALRTGFKHASGDIVIIQDADLEYNPQEYHRLIKPILDGRADVVYGSRFVTTEERRVLFFWHYLGNSFITFLSNMFTNLNLTDIETCYKVFKADVIHSITIEENRFGFEPEITAKIAKKRYHIYEIGISYSGRDYSEGKKIGWKDGIRAIWCILKYNLIKK